MSSKVIVPTEKLSNRMDEVRAFLQKEVGRGSARFGGKEGNINHWLNGDDWCYYDQWEDDPGRDPAHGPNVVNTVFVFKNEAHAVEFALRFL